MKTKYDTLKNEYDELRIRHDNAYAKKILAEAKRDKCIEALKMIINISKDPHKNHWMIEANKNLVTINKIASKTLKNNSK